ncbi:MAG TPA: LamG domain-containing protein, partial [Bacteroidia bacterium]|nr:LamG domain-containing protein [Bacteroidia bacterium]
MKKLITCLFILLSVHIYSQSGAALSFNGTGSQVDLGNSINTVLTALNTITVEAWVYPTSTSSLGVICGNYDNPTAPEMQFLLRRDADTYTFWVDDGSSFKNVSSSPASVTLNTWQHVAGVWDGAQLYIYINGVLQSTTTGVTGSNFLATSNDIIIGNDASGESFAGSIDELRIWSRPLCANDITNG